MAKKQLDDRILNHLNKKLSKHHPQSIKNAISGIKSKYGVTLNAAAKEYARKNKIKVDRWITKEDLESWQKIPTEQVQTKVVIKKTKNQKPKTVKEYIHYETKDRFVLGHIKEVNICCTYGAYTAAFILCRKIIENLLIDDIILRKYPLERDNIPIYFDPARGRSKDFSEILENLLSKKSDFGPQKQMLSSLLSKTKTFKDDANKKTHSTYHLIRNLRDLDIENVKDIFQLIEKLKRTL